MGYQLEFFGIHGRRVSGTVDDGYVNIAVTETEKTQSVRLILSEKAIECVAPETSAIIYAIAGARLYLKEAEAGVGYVMSLNKVNKVKNRYTSISKAKNEALWKFAKKNVGRYSLQYDESLDCHFIETTPTFVGLRGKEV